MEFLIQQVEDNWNEIQDQDPNADLNWDKLKKCRRILTEDIYVPAKLQFRTPEEAQRWSTQLPRMVVTGVNKEIVSVRASEQTLEMYGVRPGVKVILALRS